MHVVKKKHTDQKKQQRYMEFNSGVWIGMEFCNDSSFIINESVCYMMINICKQLFIGCYFIRIGCGGFDVYGCVRKVWFMFWNSFKNFGGRLCWLKRGVRPLCKSLGSNKAAPDTVDVVARNIGVQTIYGTCNESISYSSSRMTAISVR